MWDQIQDATTIQKVGAAAGAVAAWWEPDAFAYLITLLFVSNAADWIFGRHAARKAGVFNRTISREGMVSKALQLTIILLLRTFEAVVPMLAGTPSTGGVVASGIVVLLFIEDIESLERHLIVLGGRPVPGLSVALRRLRTLTGSERRRKPREGHGGPPAPANGEGK